MLGIDVHHADGKLDFSALKRQGIAFCYAKATEGATFTDPLYSWYRQKAGQCGILFGAYHFLGTKSDPVDQADHFLHVVGNLRGYLPPVVDAEEEGLSKFDYTDKVATFAKHVWRLGGVYPIVYAGADFLRNNLDASRLSHLHLWLAKYPKTGAPFGKTPTAAPWGTPTFWQFTDEGDMKGLVRPGSLDMNYFTGSAVDLASLVIR